MTLNTKPRPKELLRQMASGNLYREAYKSGQTLSAYLERQDPSDEYPDTKLDAFERMLQSAEIVTRGDADRGFYADPFEKFDDDDNTRALVPEWIARTWRRAATGKPQSTRSFFASGDEPLASALNPYFDNPRLRQSQIAPAIPIDQIVAITTPIDNDSYRAMYLEEPGDDARMVRVAEATEVPKTKLVGGDRNIKIYKYGRQLEVSYEVLRRQRIDKVAFWLQRLAVQAEADKVATALDTIINGDGNSGTAATSHNLTTLDPDATVLGGLTLKAWLAFKALFPNPYTLTTAFARQAASLDLQLLDVGSANIPLFILSQNSRFGGFRRINDQLADDVALGTTDDAPANKIVGIDNRFSLERVTEIGSNINEVVRWATRQTQAIVMTENEGYATFDPKAAHILDLTA